MRPILHRPFVGDEFNKGQKRQVFSRNMKRDLLYTVPRATLTLALALPGFYIMRCGLTGSRFPIWMPSTWILPGQIAGGDKWAWGANFLSERLPLQIDRRQLMVLIGACKLSALVSFWAVGPEQLATLCVAAMYFFVSCAQHPTPVARRVSSADIRTHDLSASRLQNQQPRARPPAHRGSLDERRLRPLDARRARHDGDAEARAEVEGGQTREDGAAEAELTR